MTTKSQLSVKCLFIAKNWSENPFHELSGSGKLSHASITNALSGEVEGEGSLAYLLAYPHQEGNDVAFIGYERIVARIGTRNGSFVVKHEGVFSPASGVNGVLQIVPGSGAGDFAGVAGNGTITANTGEHGGQYTLTLLNVD